MSCTYNKEINEKIKNYLTESIVDWLEANEYDKKDCENSPFLTYWTIIKTEIHGGIYEKYTNFEKWKHFHMGLRGFGADIYCLYKDDERVSSIIMKDWTGREVVDVEETANLMDYLCFREFRKLLKKESNIII